MIVTDRVELSDLAKAHTQPEQKLQRDIDRSS